jgi:hypothetical protein
VDLRLTVLSSDGGPVASGAALREEEDLSIGQIADRLGRAPATIKAYLYDRTGEKARAVRLVTSVCAGAAAPTRSPHRHGRRRRVLPGLPSRVDPGALDPRVRAGSGVPGGPSAGWLASTSATRVRCRNSTSGSLLRVVNREEIRVLGGAPAPSMRATAPDRLLTGASQTIGKRLVAVPSAPASYPRSCQSTNSALGGTTAGRRTRRPVARLANTGSRNSRAASAGSCSVGCLPVMAARGCRVPEGSSGHCGGDAGAPVFGVSACG